MAYEITIGELRKAVPQISAANAVKWAQWLSLTCQRFDINTPLRVAHFIAQLGHESWDFARVEENLNYSASGLQKTWPARFPNGVAQQYAGKPQAIANRAYGGRMGNGAEATGDGWVYRGRGLIQCTGKANYDRMTDWLDPFGAPDFVKNPDALKVEQWAAYSAGAYWAHHALNQHADRDDLETLTRRINGGTNGLEDRRKRLRQAKSALQGFYRSQGK